MCNIFCLVFQEGKVVKITKETSSENGPKVTLDVSLLKKIFYKYKNYLAAVYTVSGPFRTGKSFLQNLLVRYLKSLQLAQVHVTSTGSVFRKGKALVYTPPFCMSPSHYQYKSAMILLSSIQSFDSSNQRRFWTMNFSVLALLPPSRPPTFPAYVNKS